MESNKNIEFEDMFLMEIDGDSIQIDTDAKEVECFSHTLDICLIRIFVYLKSICYDTDGHLM